MKWLEAQLAEARAQLASRDDTILELALKRQLGVPPTDVSAWAGSGLHAAVRLHARCCPPCTRTAEHRPTLTRKLLHPPLGRPQDGELPTQGEGGLEQNMSVSFTG